MADFTSSVVALAAGMCLACLGCVTQPATPEGGTGLSPSLQRGNRLRECDVVPLAGGRVHAQSLSSTMALGL